MILVKSTLRETYPRQDRAAFRDMLHAEVLPRRWATLALEWTDEAHLDLANSLGQHTTRIFCTLLLTRWIRLWDTICVNCFSTSWLTVGCLSGYVKGWHGG